MPQNNYRLIAEPRRVIADILRLEILYTHGGVYLDTDLECLRSLDDVLGHGDRLLCLVLERAAEPVPVVCHVRFLGRSASL